MSWEHCWELGEAGDAVLHDSMLKGGQKRAEVGTDRQAAYTVGGTTEQRRGRLSPRGVLPSLR